MGDHRPRLETLLDGWLDMHWGSDILHWALERWTSRMWRRVWEGWRSWLNERRYAELDAWCSLVSFAFFDDTLLLLHLFFEYLH